MKVLIRSAATRGSEEVRSRDDIVIAGGLLKEVICSYFQFPKRRYQIPLLRSQKMPNNENLLVEELLAIPLFMDTGRSRF